MKSQKFINNPLSGTQQSETKVIIYHLHTLKRNIMYILVRFKSLKYIRFVQ